MQLPTSTGRKKGLFSPGFRGLLRAEQERFFPRPLAVGVRAFAPIRMRVDYFPNWTILGAG
jgi:hypothetical protein